MAPAASVAALEPFLITGCQTIRPRSDRRLLLMMSTLAAQIQSELECGERYTIYEFELIHIWPLNEKDREAKIAQFAEENGLRLRFYRMGWCAVFDRPRWKSRRAAALIDEPRRVMAWTKIFTATHGPRPRYRCAESVTRSLQPGWWPWAWLGILFSAFMMMPMAIGEF